MRDKMQFLVSMKVPVTSCHPPVLFDHVDLTPNPASIVRIHVK